MYKTGLWKFAIATTGLSMLMLDIAHATLIRNDISAYAGRFSQSSQFTGDIQSKTIATPYDPLGPNNITADHNETHAIATASTKIGYMFADGENTIWRGGLKMGNEFTIRDLVLTYSGHGLANPFVDGDVHISYGLWQTYGAKNANSYFDMDLRIGASSKNKRIEGGYLDGARIWEESFSFTVGETFSLRLHADMLISNILAHDPYGPNEVFIGAGGYQVALGGSPLFILPDGYTVNSLDGSIVDNYFVGNMPNSNASVPAPPTVILMGLGVLALGFTTRKRRFNS